MSAPAAAGRCDPTADPRPLPPNWIIQFDATHNAHFFVDTVSKVSTWFDPRGPAPEAPPAYAVMDPEEQKKLLAQQSPIQNSSDAAAKAEKQELAARQEAEKALAANSATQPALPSGYPQPQQFGGNDGYGAPYNSHNAASYTSQPLTSAAYPAQPTASTVYPQTTPYPTQPNVSGPYPPQSTPVSPYPQQNPYNSAGAPAYPQQPYPNTHKDAYGGVPPTTSPYPTASPYPQQNPYPNHYQQPYAGPSSPAPYGAAPYGAGPYPPPGGSVTYVQGQQPPKNKKNNNMLLGVVAGVAGFAALDALF
ncbi:hypothetical protein HK097_009054 [Rhizophlyctis rosea]|uniref:WW domain-containing protein n=1 Tax=Rhizophlyctis rosea TaxID=64517 RepID=A0AAD5SBS7_9FUNG|nr:hypothetical protein HK097_009054 [Rhizophlyctis rosea]